MPELPDVEARKNYLEKTSLNRTIEKVIIHDPRLVKGVSPSSLERALKGARFTSATRRGKNLLAFTDNEKTLLIHFGMTGDLSFAKKTDDTPKHSRVQILFEDGNSLHITNQRMIGRVSLFDTQDISKIPDIQKLGPEPLDKSFTFSKFKKALGDSKTTIHQALMDQEKIAGIGNIYSDEITFQAGIRPDRKTSELREGELKKLYRKMRWTLERAIELGADLESHPEKFLNAHRKRGGECPRCHEKIVKKVIGGRSSYYCPSCQK